MILSLIKILKVYQTFIKDSISGNFAFMTHDIHNWRERLFTNIILYVTPISLLTVVPSVIYLWGQGYRFIPALYVFAVITIPVIALVKRISLSFREGYVVFIFYFLAVAIMAVMGSFGYASIYLLSIGVFITLLFPGRAIVYAIVTNFLIYIFFAAVIYYKLFNSPLINRYPFNY